MHEHNKSPWFVLQYQISAKSNRPNHIITSLTIDYNLHVNSWLFLTDKL